MPRQYTPRVSLTCYQCGVSYLVKAYVARDNLSRFCSRVCQGLNRRSDYVQQFWSNVRKSDKEGDCWIWLGNTTGDGYGRIYAGKGRTTRAHRYSLELYLGRQLDSDKFAIHSCPGGDNPLCVNPAHLREGTPADNSADMVSRGRSTKGRHNIAAYEKMPRGENHKNAKLTWNAVAQIRALFATGDYSKAELGRRFGVTDVTIGHVVNGRLWTAA